MTDEAFVGWFDSRSGQQISSDPSQRLHVRTNGTLKYLEISKVNKTDRGTYECRGKTNKAEVMLFVECRYQGTKGTRVNSFQSLARGEGDEALLNTRQLFLSFWKKKMGGAFRTENF